MDSTTQIERSKNSYTIILANNQTITAASKLDSFFIRRRGNAISLFVDFRECFYVLFLMSSAQEVMEKALKAGSPELKKEIEQWLNQTSSRSSINGTTARKGLDLFKDYETILAKTTILKV